MSPVPPQPTPRPHPLAHPQPIRATAPEKTVTFTRHPFPALPHPTPRTSHPFPTSAPFPLTTQPRSQTFASPLETHAHPCYSRPREEPTPRPGDTSPKRGKAQASVGASKTGHQPQATHHRRAPCPTSVTRCHSCVPKTRAGRYRFAQDRRRPQLRGAQNVAESDRSFDSRFTWGPGRRGHLVI